MSGYKLDRTAFKTSTIENPQLNAEEIKSWHKLMSMTYNYPENEHPKMDRTYFWHGSMEEQDKLYNK
jgi:hypothetical protein